jgi:hypothetical protein
MVKTHPGQYVHLIIKTADLRAALVAVNTITGGMFGNVEAFDEGEKIENCMPACCCYLQDPLGGYVLRVGIAPRYLDSWLPGDYGAFVIADYPAYKTLIDAEGNEYQQPNRDPYLVGTVTDDDGNTHDIMMGSWGV